MNPSSSRTARSRTAVSGPCYRGARDWSAARTSALPNSSRPGPRTRRDSVYSEYNAVYTVGGEASMSVVVYPQLGTLLHAHGLSVAELERRIEQCFGLAVDPKTLYRLASA